MAQLFEINFTIMHGITEPSRKLSLFNMADAVFAMRLNLSFLKHSFAWLTVHEDGFDEG